MASHGADNCTFYLQKGGGGVKCSLQCLQRLPTLHHTVPPQLPQKKEKGKWNWLHMAQVIAHVKGFLRMPTEAAHPLPYCPPQWELPHVLT